MLLCVRVSVCVFVWVHVCARACVCVCARACVNVWAYTYCIIIVFYLCIYIAHTMLLSIIILIEKLAHSGRLISALFVLFNYTNSTYIYTAVPLSTHVFFRHWISTLIIIPLIIQYVNQSTYQTIFRLITICLIHQPSQNYPPVKMNWLHALVYSLIVSVFHSSHRRRLWGAARARAPNN